MLIHVVDVLRCVFISYILNDNECVNMRTFADNL